MRVLRFWRGGVAAAVLAMSAGLALAAPDPSFTSCTRTPTPSDVEGAKGAHSAGMQFFDRADYDRAIQYWKDAYSLDCSRPAILINIGNAQEKKGDRAAAISTYEAYLVRAPNSSEAPIITEKVKNLKASLQPPPPPPTTAPVAPPPPVVTAAPAETAPPVVKPPPPANNGARPFGVAPIVVASVGGAAVIAGVILLPIGLGQVSTAEKTCPNHSQCTDKATISEGNSGRTKTSAGSGLLIGGLVVAGGGVLWELLFNAPKDTHATSGREAPSSALSFTPIVDRSIAGASLSGRF